MMELDKDDSGLQERDIGEGIRFVLLILELSVPSSKVIMKRRKTRRSLQISGKKRAGLL